jgi:SAM-dependent methyltransferase
VALHNELKAAVAEIKGDLSAAVTNIKADISHINYNLNEQLKAAVLVRELYYRDMMLLLDRLTHFTSTTPATVHTKHQVAWDSDDHKVPRGTKQDNTRLPRFVSACERFFIRRGEQPRRLKYLDLGCAGGGLVLEFLLRGHEAFGIEGSDFSLLAQRSEWRLLPGNLFTADITKPFTLSATDGTPICCDVLSAWEVMEHIADEDLPQLFDNILRHMEQDGFFVGSISTEPVPIDKKTGAIYHRTVKPEVWWKKRFTDLGMRMIEDHGFTFNDFCRGTGNGPLDPNFLENPEGGFHFVALRENGSKLGRLVG